VLVGITFGEIHPEVPLGFIDANQHTNLNRSANCKIK